MMALGNGLYQADHFEDALSVEEAQLSMMRRLGASEQNLLIAQSNLASTYQMLGQHEKALRMRQDVYSGYLKTKGELHIVTLREAFNYASGLVDLKRFKEAKSLLRKTIPVARSVLGDNHRLTFRMRSN